MRGHIENLGPGRYRIRVFLGRDKNGKVKRRSRVVHGRKKDAERALTQLLEQYDRHALPEQHRLTVNAYLDQWLESSAALNVSVRTLRDYRAMLERYIRPELGLLRLEDLTPMAIQRIYTNMRRGVWTRSGRPLSPRTVQYLHRTFSQALKQAVRWRLLPSNPAELVDLPRQKRKAIQFLTPAEARIFVEAASGCTCGLYFVFLVSVGTRPSEARALGWRDFNWRAESARITRSIVEPRTAGERKWTFAPCKTDGSHRTVSIPQTLLERLREHRARQVEDKQKMGPDYQDHDLVFATALGTPHNLSNLKRSLRRVLARAGLPRMNLYSLRHTYITMQLAAGTSAKVVAEQAGHASVQVTLDTYSHVIPSLRQKAAEVAEDLLWGPDSP